MTKYDAKKLNGGATTGIELISKEDKDSQLVSLVFHKISLFINGQIFFLIKKV